MNVIKEYLNSEFRKLPRTRYYRELKKNILLDCNDKYDEYLDKYGDKAQAIIIDEIGNHKELYHGGLYPLEWFNIIINVIFIIILIYTSVLSSEAKELASNTFDVYTKLNYLPVYFILMFPTLFSWIIISFTICNVFLIILKTKVRKLRIHKYQLLIILSCLYSILGFILIFTFGKPLLFDYKFYLLYINHGIIFVILDVILGSALSYISYLYIENKVL